MPRRQTSLATWAIFAFGLVWGAAYLWMKSALDRSAVHLGDEAGGFAIALYLFVRFGLGAVVLVVLPSTRGTWAAPGAWRAGGVLGGLLLLAFVLQMHGLRGVNPAISAFLTSLYVVFTALIVRLRRRVPLELPLVCGVVLATAGAAWIGGPPELHFDGPEWLTVAGALVFGAHIVATDVLTRNVPTTGVTFVSLVVVALGSMGLLLGTWMFEGLPHGVSELIGDSDYLVAVVLSAVLATALAILLMNRYQKELPPVRAAILYALEPVWAASFAVGLGVAEPTVWLWVGGGGLIVGNLVAELAPRTPRAG